MKRTAVVVSAWVFNNNDVWSVAIRWCKDVSLTRIEKVQWIMSRENLRRRFRLSNGIMSTNFAIDGEKRKRRCPVSPREKKEGKRYETLDCRKKTPCALFRSVICHSNYQYDIERRSLRHLNIRNTVFANIHCSLP